MSEEVEPTKVEVVQSMTQNVVNAKAWARAKAGTILRNLKANGGEPSADMKAALDALVAEAGEIGPDDNKLAEPAAPATPPSSDNAGAEAAPEYVKE